MLNSVQHLLLESIILSFWQLLPIKISAKRTVKTREKQTPDQVRGDEDLTVRSTTNKMS